MNVISLFNGMGTLRQALQDLNIPVGKYYSSEIKKYAIELQQHHFPDVIQVGDINNWREWNIDWETIDFIGSGSPCQDLSAAGNRAGINGKKSSLFFVFIEILEHVKSLNPNVLFLQENVGSANKLDVGIMSRAMGLYPCRINSSLLTAQLRDRYYWTNIRTKETMFDVVTDIPQPKDLKIMFKDIITDGFIERVKSTSLLQHYIASASYKDEKSDKAQRYLKSRDAIGMCPIVYVDTDKQVSLKQSISRETSNQESLKHRNETTGMVTLIYEENNELRIKTNTKKGFDVITKNDCIDLSFPTSKTRRGRVTKGKSPCIMESGNNLYKYQDMQVRTVNQTEMERLQGFEDGYTSILSKAKAGSLLGDGWTLPIIKHILSFMKQLKL